MLLQYRDDLLFAEPASLHSVRLLRVGLYSKSVTFQGSTSAELRQAWTCLIGTPTPRVSAPILRLAIAFDLQAREAGGLSSASIRRLETLASQGRMSVPVQPGMRLVREWKGALHVVTIDEGGNLNWKARKWHSLSEVARAITGTRWSGPAFFGLVETVRSA
ncbi:DUF2924 domain-containing protein [Sphingopyxis sp. 2PD]|uniref:DUF2924 domain-containing protein n=1 Tax=Sphingopyxis sp. 2PD TaxID=2502196 RepID=UPI0010F7E029|nr:DUF2924 domain-containing protein [Sphingopyxis sp. 2PD]